VLNFSGDLLKNGLSIALALIGGFLLVQASWVGNVGFIADIVYFAQNYFSPLMSETVELVLTILFYIASLGGVAVIIGGVLIGLSRIRIGKFVIGLGAGVGFFGLIIMLVEAYMIGGVLGFTQILTYVSQSIAWIGVIMSIVARRKVKSD